MSCDSIFLCLRQDVNLFSGQEIQLLYISFHIVTWFIYFDLVLNFPQFLVIPYKESNAWCLHPTSRPVYISIYFNTKQSCAQKTEFVYLTLNFQIMMFVTKCIPCYLLKLAPVSTTQPDICTPSSNLLLSIAINNIVLQ